MGGAGLPPGTALPPLTDPGLDGTNDHSPDALVEAEKLLVGQPLALEDGNHPVVDAAWGTEEERCCPEALRPLPSFPLPLSPSCSPRGTEGARSEAGRQSFRFEGRPGAQGLAAPSDPIRPRASIPILSARSWAPSPSLPGAPGLPPVTSPGCHWVTFHTLCLPSHVLEPSASRLETRGHPLMVSRTPKHNQVQLAFSPCASRCL